MATYLGLARGVSCTAEQVVITNSTRTITHLLARVLLEPGDEVMVENPGFPGARTALVAAGVVPCPVDVDHEGLCISSGESRHPSADGSGDPQPPVPDRLPHVGVQTR
nr:aminotransferase class I/II-fold pyridoxal phosphate-dependent enzyme [Streptomyces sp. LBUM 1477]